MGQSLRQKVLTHADNPAGWDNVTLRHWVTSHSKGQVDSDVLCPFESGMQILRLPETEFMARVMKSNPKIGEKRAKIFYMSLWKLLIDARTRERKEKLKPQGGMSFKEKRVKDDQEFYVRLMERTAKERTDL